jgi:hypothetical protein
MNFREKFEFCQELLVRDVIQMVAGVVLPRGKKSMASPLRSNSKDTSFSLSGFNTWTDWGYPVSDNPRGVASGDSIDFVRYYRGCNYKEAVEYLYSVYHGITDDFKARPKVVTETITKKEAPDLPKERLSEAYQIFLDLCTIDRRTLEYLKSRGITDEEIRHYGFKTFPRNNICRELTNRLRTAGIQPESVPGLYIKKGETQAAFKYHDAILIPVKNEDGNIAGLQMRFFTKRENGPRYLWFSSSHATSDVCTYDGKTPGTPIALIDYYKRNTNTLFITEGIFKAMAINKCYGAPVLSIQGVGNFQGIHNVLKKIVTLYPNLKRVLIAYDADFISNINVTSHAVRLYQAMFVSNPILKYEYIMWDEKHGKGFDDLIHNTGGWKIQNIIKTVDMQIFAKAANEFNPSGVELMKSGNKEQIGTEFKKILNKYI